MKKKQGNQQIDIIAYFFILCIIAAGILVSLNRFWQYEVFYIDFGVFDQAIWSVSRFKPPIIEHFIVSGKWIFADHFNPSIFLLSPFYWLTTRSEMLLVVQTIAVGLSGLLLYGIAKKVLINEFLALGILSCYFLFLGLQNAVITEFHELTVSTLPLTLTFWAILNKKLRLYLLFLIITLGFKESLFATGIGIGIALFFLRKEWRLIAFITIMLSVVWGAISIKFIIPAFSNGIYIYVPTLPDGILNKVSALVDHPVKVKTLFYSFLSFGFLPIFSPAFWPLIIQDYTLRFLPGGGSTRWDLGLHYNAQSAVILAIGSVFGLHNLMKIKKFSKFLPFLGIILIINAFILYRFILHGPLALSYNPAFYEHTKDLAFLNDLIKRIPSNASIMTHNNLAVRFTHQQVWLLRTNYEIYKPDYILIDNRKGQNPNNFFASLVNVDGIIKIIKKDSSYKLIYSTQEQFVFKRLNT
ncbi:MAG: DUF2079 domain-containing protein [Candidatus Levybacteria bacterium]|nr:DUF2079 domain-containing protein [Candidatus Levybacteria bacterium]